MTLLSGISTDLGGILGVASSGGVEVDLDWSFLVTVGLFVVLFVTLKPVLFDPMLKLFEEREKRIDGARHEARAMDEKSAGALAKYEAEMQKVRNAANLERDKIRGEGTKTEADILAKVRSSTAVTVEEGRKRAAEEVAKARRELQATSRELAKDFASRVLGREVSG